MAIDLRLLRCALALAQHGTFARAAQVVHVSQPALSRSIQEIERRLGTQLFERTTGGVVPTDAGKIFLDHAREVVARAADLNREMDLFKGLDKGELSIGSGTYPSEMLVDQAVARLLRAHPAVRLRIETDNWTSLLPLLRRRELDFAVINVAGLEDEPELNIVRLNPHQGYFVVRSRHPLLESKKPVTLQQILQFPAVATSRFTAEMLKRFLAGAVKEKPASSAVKSFPAVACESIAMMKTIVAGTDVVSMLPLNVIMPEVDAGQLVVLPLVVPWIQGNFGVVRLAHRSLSPVGETFVRFLLEVDAEVLEFEQRAAKKLFAAPKRTPPGQVRQTARSEIEA
jgi:DNA-binding transcriptional LysR family regulator